MRSAGVPSFELVTLAVFSTRVLRVFNITHLRQTVRVVLSWRSPEGKI
jgi:hypothetical protein